MTEESEDRLHYSGWERPELHKIRKWMGWFKREAGKLPKPQWRPPSSKVLMLAPFPNGGSLKLKRDTGNGEQWILNYHRTMHGGGLAREDMIRFLEISRQELSDMVDLLHTLPESFTATEREEDFHHD